MEYDNDGDIIMQDMNIHEHLNMFTKPISLNGHTSLYINASRIKSLLKLKISQIDIVNEEFKFTSFIYTNKSKNNIIIYYNMNNKDYNSYKHSIWVPLSTVCSNEKFIHAIQKKLPNITFTQF